MNHNYIGVEHILLGLIREGEGVAARALKTLGVELEKARMAVQFLIGRGTATTAPSEITLSPRTKKVIELSIDEARKLGHGHVGTEHLLLGLAREGGHLAAGVLESLGVSLDKVRHQVIATLGQGHPGEATAAAASPGTAGFVPSSRAAAVDRLDAEATRALTRAYWEAGRLNHEQVGPEHLLLALIASDSAWVRRVLTQMDVHIENLASLIIAAGPAREGARPAEVTEGAELTDTINRAAALAASRNSLLVRPEHLLLAVAAGQGIGASSLELVGVTAARLRDVIDRMER